MKFQLDVALVENSSSMKTGVLKENFQLKKNEVQVELGLDDATIKNEISKRILKLGSKNIKDKKTEARARKETAEKVGPTWEISKHTSLPSNSQIKFVDVELQKAVVVVNQELFLVNLASGKFKNLKTLSVLGDSVVTPLANKNEVLLQSPAPNSQGRFVEFQVLDLLTGKMRPWGQDSISKIQGINGWEIKLKPDGKSLIAINEKKFLVLDVLSGVELSSGVLPHELLGKWFVLNADQIAFNSQVRRGDLHIYRFSTKEVLDIPQSEDGFLLSNGDLLYNSRKKLVKYEAATQTFIERSFDSPVDILAIDGDKIWISQDTFTNDMTALKQIDVKDLQDSTTGVSQEFQDYGLKATLIGDQHIAIHSYHREKNIWGLYNKANLRLAEWFESSDADALVTMNEIYSSADGRTLILVGENSAGHSQFETWKKK